MRERKYGLSFPHWNPSKLKSIPCAFFRVRLVVARRRSGRFPHWPNEAISAGEWLKSDIDFLYSQGVRLSSDAHDFLEKSHIGKEALDAILSMGKMIITLEDIELAVSAQKKIPSEAVVSRFQQFKPPAKEHSPNFRIIESTDVSGKTTCTGKLEDFVAHFQNRFSRISSILEARVSRHPVIGTKKLKSSVGSEVRLIAMVCKKQMTKKGNVLVEVEDLDGTAKVVIVKDTSAFKEHGKILKDDILAFDGKVAEELLICNNIEWPDIPVAREQKKTEEDIAIAYLSDIHVGSKKFLEHEFNHFIRWLNGSDSRQDLAGKIRYIIIAGDLVDGIGIYPEQEKELAIKDIYKQYEMLKVFLEKIPDHIVVIVGPGNHDAVRRAEPQPTIPSDMLTSNAVRIGSPTCIDIEGLRHLIYHGNSLDSVIAECGLTYDQPQNAMLELLRRRHLSPVYGQNLIVPEKHDYLVVDYEPDVVHMGHVHKNGYMVYRGTALINSGTFQDRTDFQIKMGHMPSPGVVPILETKTGKISHIGFGQMQH